LTGSQQTCFTCVYWEPSPAQADGKCRRYPPTPDPRGQVREDGVVDALYVRTAGEEWCGEWRARKAARDAPPPDEAPDEPPAQETRSDVPPEESQAKDLAPAKPRAILDEDSYARLRRLYTVAEIRALVLTGQGTEETALRELAHLEEVYQKRRG
jgi:hypothetical protein